jgi:hypothetical protein
VVFDESVFPFSKLSDYSSTHTSIDASALLLPSHVSLSGQYDNVTLSVPVSTDSFSSHVDGSLLVATGGQQHEDGHNSEPEPSAPKLSTVEEPNSEEVSSEPSSTQIVAIQEPNPCHGMRTRLKDNIRQPKKRIDGIVAYLAHSGNSDFRL